MSPVMLAQTRFFLLLSNLLKNPCSAHSAAKARLNRTNYGLSAWRQFVSVHADQSSPSAICLSPTKNQAIKNSAQNAMKRR